MHNSPHKNILVMEDVTKFFDDIFDWEMVPKPSFEHAEEKRDSSALSTFLSEFFSPDPQVLPFPYGQQVCTSPPVSYVQNCTDVAGVIKTCEAFLKANTVRGKQVSTVREGQT